MRRVGIPIAIGVAVIIVAVAIFAATFDPNRYRGTIQLELEKRLGRKVTLGDMRFGAFPPRLRVQYMAIADDPKFNPQKPFVTAQKLDVSVRLLPLLKKSFEIDSLYLERPSVELIKNGEGAWNFLSLGNATEKPERARFSLSRLVIHDGQTAITDLKTGEARSVYDHIDVTLGGFALDQPFSINVAAHLPGSGAQQLKLQGQGGPIVRGQPAATPFHGTLELKQVGIGGLQKFLNSPALSRTDGTLSGQNGIRSESGRLSAKGNMDVQNAKVNGHNLGYPVTAEYNISLDIPSDMLTIHNATIKLGTTPLLISGAVDSKATPARIDLKVRADNVSIAEAAKLAASLGVAFAPGTTVTGKVNAVIQARGIGSNPALSGTISGRDVQITGKGVREPVRVRAVNLTLTPAEIGSDNFNVTSGETTLAAQFTLRQYLSKTPLIDGTLRAPNAGLPAVLSMARAYGVTALDRLSGDGTLSINLHAAGPLQSVASAAITRALGGTLNLNANDVRYTGRDVSHELAAIGGFLGASEKEQGLTHISRIKGNVDIRNGIAQTNNMRALLGIGNVALSGTANLVNQALNLRLTAILSKDFSHKVGGTGIGGYMQTALANNRGELVIPALVTGTFQNPRFSPDLQQVARMKLKGLVPNFDNPEAGISGLLGNLLGQKAGPQAQRKQQPAQPQNPIQELVDIFGKKKK